jgi:hypothetical protein
MATTAVAPIPILGSITEETEFLTSPPGAIMRTLSTLFAATFAAAFVLSSLAITAATPSARPARRER